MKHPEQVNPQGQKADGSLPEVGRGERGHGEQLFHGYGVSFWDD